MKAKVAAVRSLTLKDRGRPPTLKGLNGQRVAHSHGGPRLLAVGMACLVALVPAVAAACARDGIPSVSANGHLAVLNKTNGVKVITTWSLFIFRRSVPHGRAVTLAENNREVARALPHEVFTHPWRWDFGDHSKVGYGTQVRHTYHSGGTYRITVLAYYPAYGAWEPFDAVTIHVQ